jgi:subtilisin family serine protease
MMPLAQVTYPYNQTLFNMRKIILLILLLLACFSSLAAQDDYRKDHVIVFFHDGVLNKSLLVSDMHSFNRTELVVEKTLADSLDKWRVGSVFQKVVRNARPDKMVSTSRTGEEVPVPMFYNLVYVPVPEDEDALSLCKMLEALPFVIFAEPDYLMKNNDVPAPNDPYFYLQRGWEQANDRDIDLLRAWDFTRGSNVVRVGVLDSGIDYHNPDLGNGSFGAGHKVSGGYDYIDDDSDPDDAGNSSHGTAVAGIIGAFSNNDMGVAGIAGGDATVGNTGVQLISLRISEPDGSRPIGKVVEGIYDGATSVGQGGFGCHILNYSGGGYTVYNSVRKAISYAVNNGVVFVASKGNSGTTNQHYPSDYADNLIISVGASDGADLRAGFSNYGNNMDFVAPGTPELLYTTIRVEQGSYGTFSGTSGAAPVVTGIAALLKSVNINLHRDDIENILQISADPVRQDVYNYVNGYHEQMGHGRVNAGRALELLHEPYVLQHHTTVGGTSQKITSGDGEGLIFLNDAGTTLPEGWYFGQKYQVTKTVDIPLSACNESYVWTRTVGATSGWSAANQNNNLGYSHIVSQAESTLTLRTYVYYIKHNAEGKTINAWHPVSPQNTSIAYTTLTNMPISSTISGPSIVCNTNTTFSLDNLPPNYFVTWDQSYYLTYVSGQGTENFTVKATGPATSGEGWVQATITGECGTWF